MGVELLSYWSFQLSSAFWILLDLKYLFFPPFFLSSLLTLWDALFRLIMKNGWVWHIEGVIPSGILSVGAFCKVAAFLIVLACRAYRCLHCLG